MSYFTEIHKRVTLTEFSYLHIVSVKLSDEKYELFHRDTQSSTEIHRAFFLCLLFSVQLRYSPCSSVIEYIMSYFTEIHKVAQRYTELFCETLWFSVQLSDRIYYELFHRDTQSRTEIHRAFLICILFTVKLSDRIYYELFHRGTQSSTEIHRAFLICILFSVKLRYSPCNSVIEYTMSYFTEIHKVAQRYSELFLFAYCSQTLQLSDRIYYKLLHRDTQVAQRYQSFFSLPIVLLQTQ